MIRSRSGDTLRVGATDVGITPASPLPLCGFPEMPRFGSGVHCPLRARVLVVDDGETRAALVTLDLIGISAETAAEVRTAVAQRGECDADRVLVTCSHTHSAPCTVPFRDTDPDEGYLDHICAQVGDAARLAARAIVPAYVRTAVTNANGLTFNRRPVYDYEGREEVATQGPRWVRGFVRTEAPEDTEVRLVWFEAPDGRCVAGLVNFACHPTVVGSARTSRLLYSADYPGLLTKKLSQLFGGVFLFIQGAAGDQSPYDPTRPDAIDHRGVDWAEVMAGRLAELATQTVPTARTLRRVTVQVASKELELPQRTVSRAQVDLARAYLEKMAGHADVRSFTSEISGHPFTFWDGTLEDGSIIQGHDASVVQEWLCREAIGIWEWQRRSTVRHPARETAEVQALVIGNVAIVGYPGELFSTFGRRMKEQADGWFAMVAELANGDFWYIPTAEAFGHGGYEPRRSRLYDGAGEAMVDAALEILGALSPAKDRDGT